MCQHCLPYGGLAHRGVQPPGAAFMRAIFPPVPTCIPLARLVVRCLGTVLAGGPTMEYKNQLKTGPLAGRATLCLPQGQSPTVLQDLGGATLVQALLLQFLSLPSRTASSALRHSNPSLALCHAVVLTIYLLPSFLVDPLAKICTLVPLSRVVSSLATSCAASGLGSAMWIPTHDRAHCDTNDE